MQSDKPSQRFTVVVSEDQLERIDREAHRQDRPRSNFARRVLMDEIERREREREEEAVPACKS